MLNLSSTQAALVASQYKEVTWLFKVVDANDNVYGWSIKSADYQATDWEAGTVWEAEDAWEVESHTFKVIKESFNGIQLNRASSEVGINAPNNLTFSVVNPNNVLTAANFVGGWVAVRLVVGDGTTAKVIRGWRFYVKRCESAYQKLNFICVDFLQAYLNGEYPNTPFVKDISLSDDTVDDNVCVPVPFGTAYIPLRSIYVVDQRYYLLGPSDKTYTLNEISSPREWGNSSVWTSDDFVFSQSTKIIDGTSYKVAQFLIADVNNDGVGDANGLWKSGDKFLDALVKFSRSDTASLTNPADVIEYILKDFGIPSLYIDTGVGSTFETAYNTFAAWGLQFNGAFFSKNQRKQILSSLLNQCHAVLDIGEKIELRVLSKTSRGTVNKTNILKGSGSGEGTFSYSPGTQVLSDAGYAAFQETGKPQDSFIKTLVSVKTTKENIASEVLEFPLVQNSVHVRKLAKMYYQRKFMQAGNISCKRKGSALAIQPDDVETISHADYGGTYDVLVDSIKINLDLSLDFSYVKFSDTLDDWSDLTFDAVIVASEDSENYWSPVISGPNTTGDASGIPHKLSGTLRIGAYGGNYIELNGATGIRAYDLILGRTIWLPTDGSAPEFSSGVIKECEYQIYTSGVIKTSENPMVDGGFLINNSRAAAYNTAGVKLYEIKYDGEDEGDFYVGDFDNNNHGLKYDHSTGRMLFKGEVAIVDGTIGGVPIDEFGGGSSIDETARQAAQDAQGAADAANLLLADIANDDKLTASEKQQTKLEWDVIVAEKTGINNQATAFGITTENTNYNNAYTALNNYITPLLADLSTTSDIVGTTFRTNFANLYSTRQTLLNKIAARAKEFADTAQGAAENAQTDANTANNLLSDIASDNKLTASEKQQTKLEWDGIVAEKSSIDSQADIFGITTEKTSYGNAYTALSNYITPLLSSLTTTSDIVGTTFRTNFANLYSTRQVLLNKIADEAGRRALIYNNDDSIALGFNSTFSNWTSTYPTGWVSNSNGSNGLVKESVIKRIGDYAVRYNSTTLLNRSMRYTAQFDSSPLIEGTFIAGTVDIMIDYVDPANTTGKPGIQIVLYKGAALTSATTINVVADPSQVGPWQRIPFTARVPSTSPVGTRIYAIRTVLIGASNNTAFGSTQFLGTVIFDNLKFSLLDSTIDTTLAYSSLADIAADNKLTPVEKHDIRKEWNGLAAEKAGINSQATSFGITTENTNYNNAFQELANYLNNGTTWSSGVPLWISDENLSTTTVIVGSTFRTNFSNLYSTKQILINKIADEAGKRAAWTNVANIPTELTDGRISAGLNSAGEIIKSIKGSVLPTTDPDVAGLHLTQNYMGYWNNGWKSYIAKDGKFYFTGNASNYIQWNGTDLAIRGRLVADDIISGGIRGININAGSFATIGSFLTDSISLNAITLPLNNTSDFSSSGGSGFIIDSSNNYDYFTYTGKTEVSLTGCVGLLTHTSGAVAIPNSEAVVIDSKTNKMYYYDINGFRRVAIGNLTEEQDSFQVVLTPEQSNGIAIINSSNYSTMGFYAYFTGSDANTYGIYSSSVYGYGGYFSSSMGTGIKALGSPAIHGYSLFGYGLLCEGNAKVTKVLEIGGTPTQDSHAVTKLYVDRIQHIIHIQDFRSSGEDGGTFTLGDWRARTINMTHRNGITGSNVNLELNYFQLPPGTYYTEIGAYGDSCGFHKVALRNISDNTFDLIGENHYTPVGAGGEMAWVFGKITIAGVNDKQFQVWHRCSVTRTADGMGRAAGFGVAEVYCDIRVWKVL